MAVAVDTSSHATAAVPTGATGITWAHTCGASATKLSVLLGIGVGVGSLSNLFNAAYNGVTMTLQINVDNAHFCGVQCFYLDSPATGSSLNIVVNRAGDAVTYQLAAVGISFNGATSGAPQTGGNSADPGANGAVQVNGSVNGDIVIGSIMSDFGPTGSTTEGQTLIFEDEDINADTDFNAQRTNATGANTVLSWTHGSDNWAAAAMAINGGSVPTINTQPSDASAYNNDTAAFSVTATASAGSLTYQWQVSTDYCRTFSNVSTGTGGTSATFTTASLVFADDQTFFLCNVTDTNGTIATRAASLRIKPRVPSFAWRKA